MSGTFPHLNDHIAMGVFDVFQIPYSAVEREHEAAITAASEAGAGIVIRGGAAEGAPAPEADRNAMEPLGTPPSMIWDMTPVEFVLRFTFSHPDIDTTTVGTVNPAHLAANLA